MRRKTFHLSLPAHKRLKRLSRLTKMPMTTLFERLTEAALEGFERAKEEGMIVGTNSTKD